MRIAARVSVPIQKSVLTTGWFKLPELFKEAMVGRAEIEICVCFAGLYSLGPVFENEGLELSPERVDIFKCHGQSSCLIVATKAMQLRAAGTQSLNEAEAMSYAINS
jgi:hypothetical protein